MSQQRLIDIAVARSGDKGGGANIGVIARSPEHWPTLRAWLTAECIERFFADLRPVRVERFELPNLHALNFVLHGVLADGDPLGGGSTSLRTDAQGKALAQRLLTMPLEESDER